MNTSKFICTECYQINLREREVHEKNKFTMEICDKCGGLMNLIHEYLANNETNTCQDQIKKK